MPRALFVTTVAITLEAFLLPLADALREEGWRVDALANGATGSAAVTDHFDRAFDASWSRNPLSPAGLRSGGRVRVLVRENAYDVVHVHTPVAAFLTRRALSRLDKAERPVVIYTAHGFHFHRGGSAPANAAFRGIERAAARWTDFLVTVNEEDFAEARRFGTIPAERVRLVPGIGVDTMRFSPTSVSAEDAAAVRRGLDVADDAVVVTMVAEFLPGKRHALAVRALAGVRDPRVVLVMAGDGPLLAHTRTLAKDLGITDRVRFAGFRRDVPALLDASDLFLLTSEREGLNRSVLEAMSAGLPVIGVDARGVTDAIGDGGGWVVASADPLAVARAIDEAAARPAERARRGAAGRKRALSEYAEKVIVDAYKELYREALASRL